MYSFIRVHDTMFIHNEYVYDDNNNSSSSIGSSKIIRIIIINNYNYNSLIEMIFRHSIMETISI